MQLYAFPKDDGFPWSSHHTSSAVLLVVCGTHPGLAFWMHETRPSVCNIKDLDTATQPFPWHLSTDAVSLRKVEIARLDHPQGPFTPLAFSDSGRTRCFGRKWKKPNPWVLQAEQCPQIWEVWARPSSALLSAFSYPSSWFSALSNINVCVFHDCETAFLGVVSLL